MLMVSSLASLAFRSTEALRRAAQEGEQTWPLLRSRAGYRLPELPKLRPPIAHPPLRFPSLEIAAGGAIDERSGHDRRSRMMFDDHEWFVRTVVKSSSEAKLQLPAVPTGTAIRRRSPSLRGSRSVG